jgi:ABC-type Fe3+-hydroxamate transport system substrate-binding protein
MTVGNDTFIHDLMLKAGLVNIFHQKTRYPEVTFDELRNAACDVVLLSSEPYPFKETHRIELQKQLPGTKIILVDGEMFSWYGSHLIKAPGYFLQLRASLI